MKRLVCIAHLQYSEILKEEDCVLMVFIFQICLFDESVKSVSSTIKWR